MAATDTDWIDEVLRLNVHIVVTQAAVSAQTATLVEKPKPRE